MNLLINEPPLQVLPSLAVAVGLNEAIMLQQIHYWMVRSNHYYEGKRWIYNSVSSWEKQFPFLSRSTIKRTISNLETKEILIVGNFNRLAMDRTKWYTINYEVLKTIGDALVQNEPMVGSNWNDGTGQFEPTNTREYTETTTNKDISRKQAFDDASDEMILVEHFIKQIRKNRPTFVEPPNKQTWGKQFNLMLNKDQRDKHEIGKVINFVQSNPFWMANCLSPKKLREKYDQLAIQMLNQQQTATPIQKVITKQEAKPVNFDLNAGEDD